MFNFFRKKKASKPEVEAAATAPAAPADFAQATPARASARPRRTKTRLIGFDTSQGDVVGLFDGPAAEEAAETAEPAPATMLFPVGWALVVEGPGRGTAFALAGGMSSIGRGADQAVRLDFGDTTISRSSHAAIVYDTEDRSFLLGHGGKSNIVRLNGKPVISNETLKDGDEIKVGETLLRLKTLCGADFDWSDTEVDEENDDVAIA